MKSKRGMGLATSLSLSFKRYLEKIVFNDLSKFNDAVPSGLWVIPKITFADLCKSIHNVKTILVSSLSLNLKTGKKGGKLQKTEDLDKKKSWNKKR